MEELVGKLAKENKVSNDIAKMIIKEAVVNSVSKLEAPAPIPTMGQWGIIILGLLTTIFGVVMMNEQYFKLAKIKS